MCVHACACLSEPSTLHKARSVNRVAHPHALLPRLVARPPSHPPARLSAPLPQGSGKARANRMFFLSIPPNVFIGAAGGAADFCSTK